jgi:hypothetical protein
MNKEKKSLKLLKQAWIERGNIKTNEKKKNKGAIYIDMFN